jgi:hypothetical protein
MNDSELESKLKRVPLPVRSEEYWENFPAQVRANLRRSPAEIAPHNFPLPGLAWSGGFSLACLTLALLLGSAFHVCVQDGKKFHRELTELPGHLRVFMADEHGLHYLIADKNN